MSKFRKKPVVIEAVQLLWSTWSEMCDHAGIGTLANGKPEGCYIGPDGQPLPNRGRPLPGPAEPTRAYPPSEEIGLLIPTLEGLMIARQNDWIIRGVKGELYPCKPDIFDATYEPAD